MKGLFEVKINIIDLAKDALAVEIFQFDAILPSF